MADVAVQDLGALTLPLPLPLPLPLKQDLGARAYVSRRHDAQRGLARVRAGAKGRVRLLNSFRLGLEKVRNGSKVRVWVGCRARARVRRRAEPPSRRATR